MESHDLYIIRSSARVIDALNKLNNQGQPMTLFVVDESGRMIGTITDGDIRRRFVAGTGLDDSVSAVMNSRYKYLQKGRVDVSEITIPDYICCACFNILREHFFGFYGFLSIMNRKKTPRYGYFCCRWR